MNIKSGLTAVFEKTGNEYIGYIEEIPGVNTQGATIEEARVNLQEALELILEVRREMATEEQAGRTIIKEEIKMVA
ncbi:MAG: type II toxin-antitoxin system HicB family antitoxin [Chitinophagales bacterium]